MALSKDDIFASEEEELNLMTLFADDEEKPADDKPADDDKGGDDKDKRDDDKPADDDKGGKDDDKGDDDDDDVDAECCKSNLAYESVMFESCDDLFEEAGDKSDPDLGGDDDKGGKDDDKPADDDKGGKDDKKDDDKPADDDKGGKDDKPEDKDDDNKPEKEEGKECGLNSDEEFAFDDIDVFACGAAGCDCEKKADEEPEPDDNNGVSNDASSSLFADSLFSGLSDF